MEVVTCLWTLSSSTTDLLRLTETSQTVVSSHSPHPFVVVWANVKASSISLYLGTGVCVFKPGYVNKREGGAPVATCTFLCICPLVDVCIKCAKSTFTVPFAASGKSICEAARMPVCHAGGPPVSPSPLHSALSLSDRPLIRGRLSDASTDG